MVGCSFVHEMMINASIDVFSVHSNSLGKLGIIIIHIFCKDSKKK